MVNVLPETTKFPTALAVSHETFPLVVVAVVTDSSTLAESVPTEKDTTFNYNNFPIG